MPKWIELNRYDWNKDDYLGKPITINSDNVAMIEVLEDPEKREYCIVSFINENSVKVGQSKNAIMHKIRAIEGYK